MTRIEDYGIESNDIGRVVKSSRDLFVLVTAFGEKRGKLKTSVYFNANNQEKYPTVGDYVKFESAGEDFCLITKTMERKTVFYRTDLLGKVDKFSDDMHKQIVAANFDYVFIVTSLNNDLNTNRIERYLAMGLESGAIPVVILTKADLCEEKTQIIESVRKITAPFEVLAISVVTGENTDALKKYLMPGKTIVFLGSSGVGKSTLLNFLAGEDIMATAEIREDDSRGRHTTTHRELRMLKSKVMVIDTPGMREIGIIDAEAGINSAFGDVNYYSEKCKFKNCTHKSEPGCAVLKAIKDGDLSEERFARYSKLLKESAFLAKKSKKHKAGKINPRAKNKKDLSEIMSDI